MVICAGVLLVSQQPGGFTVGLIMDTFQNKMDPVEPEDIAFFVPAFFFLFQNLYITHNATQPSGGIT